ncbi:MAG: methylated-DNA--[protein]-cysteine S-methyltransferase [Pseudonocardiales bacterium]|nr:methylated-DNA--[protein]-cysteine S-methyltransferase [Pseudonocardiales bacterium]
MAATDEQVLSALRSDDAAELLALRLRLAESAERAGTLDVAYVTMESPVGLLLLAATGRGIARVAFAGDDGGVDAVLTALAARLGPRILRSAARLDDATVQLSEYFAGARREFDLPLDLTLAVGAFRRDVLGALPSIAYGATASYAEVARSTGRPLAVRAVGTACALNPLPLLIPCHRVVRSDGTPGSYAGGPEAKRRLLDLESAA